MCFSPTAGFVTAGPTGTVGTVTLSRTTGPREWPLDDKALWVCQAV